MRNLGRWLASLAFFSVSAALLGAADWRGFRGDGSGTSPDNNLPTEWSQDNVLWKIKLPGAGTSSPILVGDKIYLTAYSGYGQKISAGMGGKGKGDFKKGDFKKGDFKGGFGKGAETGDQKALQFHVLCYDRANGNLVWKKDIEPKLPEMSYTGFMSQHGYTSSTPVSDGKNIYVFLGKTGVLAFDLAGKQLWQTGVGTGIDQWGSASSPVVHDGVVIVNANIESQAIVGLDVGTGEEKWRVKNIAKNWTSPILVKNPAGKTECVISLPGKVISLEPATGKQLWTCEGIGGGGMSYTISSPVAKDGIVYVVGGGGPQTPKTSFAIKTGGSGNVTETHVLWKVKNGNNIASPVINGDLLCWVSGTATALKTSDGSQVTEDRLYDSRSEYVSAVAAGGNIFALTRTDGLFVLGRNLQKLSHFTFEGDDSIFNASPAIGDGKVYLRSNAYLYCIGKK